MQENLKLQVRLPVEIHKWLLSNSKDNDRSLNGQIVSILRQQMQLNLKQNSPAA